MNWNHANQGRSHANQGRSHPSDSNRRENPESLYQGAMMLKQGIKGTQHQWPLPLNL